MKRRSKRWQISRIRSTVILATLCVLTSVSIYLLDKDYKQKVFASNSSPKEIITVESSTSLQDNNLYQKLKNKQFIRTLVVGDSIGQGAGASDASKMWFNLVSKNLQTNFKITNFMTNISIGGASVFGGLIDYNKLNNSKKFDVAFICFGQNDQGQLSTVMYSNVYEALIRKIKEEQGNPEIFLIIENAIANDNYPNELMKLAQKYDLNVINTKEAFHVPDLKNVELSNDNVHPNDKGHEIYSKLITDKISENLNNNRTVSYDKNLYVDSGFNKYLDLTLSNSFSTVQNFVKNSNSYLGNNAGDSLEAEVSGNIAGIKFLQSTDGGMFTVFLDGKKVKDVNTYSPFPRSFTFLINDNLEKGKHIVRIEATGTKSQESTGTKVEITEIVTNKIFN